MLRSIVTAVILLSSLIAGTASAALDLELTQGVSQAIPVALQSFANEEVLPKQISPIVQSDLQNSGQFAVTMAPATGKAINYQYWRNQKINALINGGVEKTANGYQVSVALYDIYNHKQLLAESFTCQASQTRSLAHHISDLIYQQLTGIPGIFSTKIAYVLVQRSLTKPAKFSLMVADQDGHNPQTLLVSPEPIMSPAWSPNGKQIAYVSFEHKRAAIYLQNLATGKRRIVTKYPGINGAPAWSPDGTKLALVLTNTGYPKIYMLSLTNNKLTQLTSGWSLDTEPSWAPDGKSLVFTSNREGGPQIYRVNVATHKVQRVTYQGSYNARAAFTPDGKSIVMLHREQGMFTIATQDLASGRINLLTASGMNESPSIAPNGTMVVYATNYGDRGILAEVSIDGQVKLRLPAQEGEVQEPAWGPITN